MAALLCGACSRVPVASAVADATPPFEVVAREQIIAVDAATRVLRLRNPHGDLRVRVNDAAQAELYATVQLIGEQPLNPSFDVVQHGGRLEIDVRYPGEAALLRRADHRYGRTDLAIFVPARLLLDIETTDGLLQVRNARGGVRARSGSGQIQVSGDADLDLESTSGDIAFSQISGQWTKTVSVRTGGGKVFATLPIYSDIVVDARGGRIEIEGNFPVQPVTADGGMHLLARFGAALRSVRIDSGSGVINLRAGIAPLSPRAEPETGSR